MKVETMVALLRARAPWRSVARVGLKDLGLPAGMGWDDTAPDLLAANALTVLQKTQLETMVLEHLVVGEKSLRIYEVGRQPIDALIASSASKKPSAHAVVNGFPSVLSDAAMAAIGDVPPKFGRCIADKEGSALVFAGIRSYTRRVELDPTKIQAVVPGMDFESVIGVVNHRRMTYDAVWLPKTGKYLYVLADYPQDATSDFPAQSHLALERGLAKAMGVPLTPVDLFPAVQGLYDTPDGDVVELGFITDDDSVKHLKARQGKKCLRKDGYHTAGATFVGNALLPFRIAVRWQRKLNGLLTVQPEILLPGTSRTIYGVNNHLYDCVLRNCLGLRDLVLIKSKLSPHI
jgi:hypothetical protein